MKAIIEIEVTKNFGQVYIKFPETGHCCDSVLEPSELEDADSTLEAIREIVNDYIDNDIKRDLE